MNVLPLDKGLFGPVFVTDEVRAAHGTDAWLEDILRVESALAMAQASLGIIPQVAADAIDQLTPGQFDQAALEDRTAAVGFPIAGIVEQIAELVPDGLGEYAHWGATTQDILDTAQVLQISRAIDQLESELLSIGAVLAQKADAGRDTLMLARSQGQAALPTTFGLRVSGWLSSLTRHIERLRQAKSRVLVVQLSGAVGTAAAYGPHATELMTQVARLLDLEVAHVNWHTQRDRFAEIASIATGIAASIGKIGLDVSMSAQPGIGETRELPGASGGGVSSTMPQKQNPILSQQLVQNARIAKSLLPLAFEAVVSDHDRGMGIWPVEWFAMPQLMTLTLSSVAKLSELLEVLAIDEERMAANLASHDKVMAEAVMMALAPELGRQSAHDAVAAAIRAMPDAPLGEALAAAGIEVAPETLDPHTYLGSSNEQIGAAIAEFSAISSTG